MNNKWLLVLSLLLRARVVILPWELLLGICPAGCTPGPLRRPGRRAACGRPSLPAHLLSPALSMSVGLPNLSHSAGRFMPLMPVNAVVGLRHRDKSNHIATAKRVGGQL